MIRIIKLRRMRWVGHVARKGEEEHVLVIGGKARGKGGLIILGGIW
jgi:hypothetical protein